MVTVNEIRDWWGENHGTPPDVLVKMPDRDILDRFARDHGVTLEWLMKKAIEPASDMPDLIARCKGRSGG